MRDSSMPAVTDVTDAALSNEHPTRAEDVLPRAEQVIPPGFRPLRWPHIVDVDAQTSTDDEPMIVAQGDLRITAEALGSVELLATILDRSTGGGSPIAQQIAEMARFWQRHVRLVGGLAVALLVAVGLAVAPVGGQAAQAATAGKTRAAAAAAPGMEGPWPDPVTAPMYRVVLSGATATIRVPLVLTGRVGSVFCGSVYGPDLTWGYVRVGHACSTSRFVTVTATLAASALKYGPHNVIWLADDSIPDAETAAIVDTRRASRFGRGTWTPTIYGDGLTVTASLYAYTPSVGTWTPQQASPVYIQEFRVGRWVTVATLTTNRRGIATGSAILGGGLHTVRVARPAGQSVWATTGTARTFYLAPTDIPIDVI